MSSENEIPESLQRVLNRIGYSISEAKGLNAKVVIDPDVSSIQIFSAIEKFGRLSFEELQRSIGISPEVLSARLHTLVSLGVLAKKQHHVSPELAEYFVADNDDGTSGQPAVVLA